MTSSESCKHSLVAELYGNEICEAGTSSSVRNAIEACCAASEAALDALAKGLRLSSPASTPESSTSHPPTSILVKDYKSLLTLIDSHITRLGLSLKPPITQAGIIKYSGDLAAEFGRLGSCALSVSPSEGIIRKELVWGAQEVIEGIGCLCNGLHSLSDDSSEPPEAYLRLIGSIHNSLDKLRAELSPDNASAVEKRWKFNSDSMGDALGELKNLLDRSENDGEDKSENEIPEELDDMDDMFGDNNGEKLSPEELFRAKQVRSTLLPYSSTNR